MLYWSVKFVVWSLVASSKKEDVDQGAVSGLTKIDCSYKRESNVITRLNISPTFGVQGWAPVGCRKYTEQGCFPSVGCDPLACPTCHAQIPATKATIVIMPSS
jgi:hypothetical protein